MAGSKKKITNSIPKKHPQCLIGSAAKWFTTSLETIYHLVTILAISYKLTCVLDPSKIQGPAFTSKSWKQPREIGG